MDLRETLRDAVAVPVITADDPARTVELCRALAAGGLTVLEITLRTSAALDAVAAVARALPQATVGVGTLLDAGDAARVGVPVRLPKRRHLNAAAVHAKRAASAVGRPSASASSNAP